MELIKIGLLAAASMVKIAVLNTEYDRAGFRASLHREQPWKLGRRQI